MTSHQRLREQFIAIIDDYNRACGVASESSIPGEGDVSMEAEWMGVPLLVQHRATLHPERLLVRCELGESPSENEEPVLRGLLQLQREMTPWTPLKLSLDPVSQRVCCSHSIPLAEASAAVLLEVFEDMVLRASEWRSTHYLEDDAAPIGFAQVAELVGGMPGLSVLR